MAHDYARGFYASQAWLKCRAAFMQSKNYCCERCGAVAVIAHHIKHINPQNITDVNITLNWDNLLACCHDCHAAIHGYDQVCREDVQFNEHGELVPRRFNGANDLIHKPVKPAQKGISRVFK